MPVPDSDGIAELVIIEWKVKVDRLLFLCDERGNALTEMAPGIRPGPFQFTAYLRWRGFSDMGHNVLLADLGGGEAAPLVEAAKDRLREYFKERQRDREREVISDWEAQGIYPYKTEAANATEVAERQAFDVVALTAASVVNDAPERSRRLSLSLIKTALETSPAALHDVLVNVLELPADRIEELRQILDRTTLASVIEASKRIAGRLDFLSGLNALVFDLDSRKETLERRQLHRILTRETWLFGEEWALTGDDDRLTRVLKAHLAMLGEDVELADTAPVLREDDRDAIPDLVLSRARETLENRFQHLVVELKRPAHRLKPEDIAQIRSYAGAISRDERFQQPNVQWDFWLIGNSTTADVDEQREQTNLPFGVVTQDRRYTVWVKTWAEVIGDAEHRHKFVKDSLEYTTDRDQGVQYLRQKHAQYLPPALAGEPDAGHGNAAPD